MVIALVPVRVKTEGSFTAEDPWNENRRTSFNVEAYLLVPRGTRVAPGTKALAGYLYGIRSELDGCDHMMPESLVELWRTGRIPAETLPKLLQRMEPTLKKADYRPILRNTLLKITQYIFVGLMALLALFLVGVVLAFPGEVPLVAVLVMLTLIGSVGWGAHYLIFQRPKGRRMRQMEWALAQQ